MIVKILGECPVWVNMGQVAVMTITSIDGPRGFELRGYTDLSRSIVMARSVSREPLEKIADELVRGFLAGEPYAEIPYAGD